MKTPEWKRKNGRSEAFLNDARALRQFAALLLFAALPLIPAFAQSYSIDWFTIDGDGGTSTGGVYAVNGAIGQPDAGAISGGNYSLAGGFQPHRVQ